MTPPARTQAAIEALDAILVAARGGGAAADTLLARLFAQRRYMGSGDRRAVRELVFAVVRGAGEPPASGRAALLAHAAAHAPELFEHFGAGGHAPAPLAVGEAEAAAAQPRALVPRWLEPPLREALGAAWPQEVAALLERAPLDLRVNTLKATRDEALALLPGFAATPHSPWGLRGAEPLIERHAAYANGWIEVQDEGSQLVALACAAAPGMTVVDLCAGAGGKTLALAAMMAGRGRIIAADTDRARLAQLAVRAARAGVAARIEPRLLDAPREAAALADLAGAADVVLVDAPCSGSGTWRRNPEGRWRLTPERLARLIAAQDRLLGLAAALLRQPGGRLVYAVCSVLPAEGSARLAALPENLAPAPLRLPIAAQSAQTLLTPARHRTDGFFIAARQSI